jgi:hypothetical protein
VDYLVSTSEELNLEGYKKVESLDDVVMADETSVIIIHSFKEDVYKGSLLITDLYRKRGVSKFIYINAKPSDRIRVLIESINGIVEDDEYLLADKDEMHDLVALLEDNNLEVIESTLPSINTGFEVMNEFLTRFEKGDPSLTDPLYLEVVNRAVNDIRKQVSLQEERTELMGRGVIETYENTLEVINSLKKQAEQLREQLDEIESTRGIRLGKVETLSYYPPITYAGSTPLVVFKEITACRYLTSFVLAYANHLQTVRSKRVRVIIVVGKQPLIKNKYKNMFELTKDNYKSGEAIIQTVAYTTTPIKVLMLHMTKQSDELVIVLDRTYEKDPIIKGRAKVFYGVSSLSEIERENLDVTKCICSIRAISNALVTIKHISNFPIDVDSRLDKYERNFHEDFNRLDEILEMNKI